MSKPNQSRSQPQLSFESFSAIAHDSLDTVSTAFSNWLHNANQVQNEAIRFLRDRFDKDIASMSSLARCKSLDEVFRLQSQMTSELVSDYMREGARLFELLGTQTEANAAQSARPDHARTSNE